MAYGLSELRTRAETLATTAGWEFDFGFAEGINGRKTTKVFLSMLIPETSKTNKAGKQQEEEYDMKFLLYKPYAYTSTDTLDKKIATVRSDLRTFVLAYCDDTNVTLMSDINYQHYISNKDQNAEVWVFAKFKVNVTNC